MFGRTSPARLLPFAPELEEWTEEHYQIYTLVELSVGNRKEVTPEEAKDAAFAEKIEQMVEAGEPGWLEEIEKYMDGGSDIDDLIIDESMVERIEKELGE